VQGNAEVRKEMEALMRARPRKVNLAEPIRMA
jgi:hypothetical protein